MPTGSIIEDDEISFLGVQSKYAKTLDFDWFIIIAKFCKESSST